MRPKKKRKKPEDKLLAQNYCLGFIDLLGQKDAMRGETILPVINSPEEREKFLTKARKSIGKIIAVQEHAESFINASLKNPKASELRRSLQRDQRYLWERIRQTRVITQRWSDGLVVFSSLENQQIKCPMNGVYRVFLLCGMLCYLGLAGKSPVRGSIEVSWGLELKPNEIYGPIVANAFRLENEVAHYPRIVVGPIAIDYLQKTIQESSSDLYVRANAALAQRCLEMLISDEDGNAIFHYLGEPFQNQFPSEQRRELYEKSYAFVEAQQKKWCAERNTKLAFRYAQLLHYFKSFPLKSEP